MRADDTCSTGRHDVITCRVPGSSVRDLLQTTADTVDRPIHPIRRRASEVGDRRGGIAADAFLRRPRTCQTQQLVVLETLLVRLSNLRLIHNGGDVPDKV